MALFRRNPKTDDDNGEPAQDSAPDLKKKSGGLLRPADTAFRQQRLRAWQPIFTPNPILPALFAIGVIFAVIGGLFIWGSGLVTEFTFDYSQCENLVPSTSATNPTWENLTSYSYKLRASDAHASYSPPQFAFINRSADASLPVSQRLQCLIQFDVPYDLEPSVLLYYKLRNFNQNHRQYVISYDSDQFQGKDVDPHTLNKGDCHPLAINADGKVIYPCGLIANSLFNDTFSNLTASNLTTGAPTTPTASSTYPFSTTNIAWPGEAKKYARTPGYALDAIVPPPNWQLRFPDNYTAANPPPDFTRDEHFQNWMRTAALPTFAKLWGRNDADVLGQGVYQVSVGLNFPVLPYGGAKSLVISKVSWIGGKNTFLGWAFVGVAVALIVVALMGTVGHVLRPRKLADPMLLSWNR